MGKGKKVLEFNPQQDDKKEIMKACLGRTGNLRAPTIEAKNVLFVGFNDAIYDNL